MSGATSSHRSPNRAKSSKTKSERNGAKPSMDKQLVATNSPQQNLPLWKRGIKGDFLQVTKSSAILKISPSPSFSKRGTPDVCARRTPSLVIASVLLFSFLLFFPRLLPAQEPLR